MEKSQFAWKHYVRSKPIISLSFVDNGINLIEFMVSQYCIKFHLDIAQNINQQNTCNMNNGGTKII